MPICDICRVDLSNTEMQVVKGNVVMAASKSGYVPKALTKPLNLQVVSLQGAEDRTINPDLGIVTATWEYSVEKYATNDWGVCKDCHRDLFEFAKDLAKRHGYTIEAGD